MPLVAFMLNFSTMHEMTLDFCKKYLHRQKKHFKLLILRGFFRQGNSCRGKKN